MLHSVFRIASLCELVLCNNRTQGVWELARKFESNKANAEAEYFGSATQREVDQALAQFNRTRIGLRLLCDSWQAARILHHSGRLGRGRGIVQKKCSLGDEARTAASYVTEIFLENVYACPSITVIDPTTTGAPADVCYVPNHLWYVGSCPKLLYLSTRIVFRLHLHPEVGHTANYKSRARVHSGNRYSIIELLKNACLASLTAHSIPGKSWSQISTGCGALLQLRSLACKLQEGTPGVCQ